MQSRSKLISDDVLPRFPVGWYALALSSELAPGAVLTRQALGRERVLYRTMAGAVRVVDAHCPHLGAHLGHGGTVDGELLRCPFHGFRFDGGGACVATPYGKKPPAIATTHVPVRELDGLIVFHHDPTGAAPRWELPVCGTDGWSPLIGQRWVIRSHPQEILENSVDFGHFTEVHGYSGVELTRPLETDGPYLSIGYSAVRAGGLFGRLDPASSLRFRNEIHTYGLGYSRVDITIERLGLQVRQFVMPTPIDHERVELRAATSVKLFPSARGVGRYLQWLPRARLADLLSRHISGLIDGELRPDFRIWEHKRYLATPGLAAGDGPIGRYRRWTRQFYPELHAEAATTDAADVAATATVADAAARTCEGVA